MDVSEPKMTTSLDLQKPFNQEMANFLKDGLTEGEQLSGQRDYQI